MVAARIGRRTLPAGEDILKQGHIRGAGRPRWTWRETNLWAATRNYGMRAGLIVVLIVATIGIVVAPLGLEWIARVKRDWVVLGNVGQAYGGISALVSAIALVGVVGSLLIQARQHWLDKITLVRGRQAQLYTIVREDPELYWPILGGKFDNSESVRRRSFMIELLQYGAAGFETRIFSEESLRDEIFEGFFRYEENRQFWQSAWSQAEFGSTRKFRRFVTIGNEELARARAVGPGELLPYRSDSSRGLRLDRARWCLPALAGTTAVGVALLLSRRRTHSSNSV